VGDDRRDRRSSTSRYRPALEGILRFARPYRAELTFFFAIIVLDALSAWRRPYRRQGRQPDHRHGEVRTVVKIAIVIAALPSSMRWLSFAHAGTRAHRRGPDLRHAHVGVRPRAADAAGVLHRTRRRSRQPLNNDVQGPAGVHVDAVRPGVEVVSWCSRRPSCFPLVADTAGASDVPVFVLPARRIGRRLQAITASRTRSMRR